MRSTHLYQPLSAPPNDEGESDYNAECALSIASEEQYILYAAPKQQWGIDDYRLLANCLMGFSNGIADSAPGALLPYMETDYNIGYALVSLIFVANALGYLFAAPRAHAVDSKAGRAGAYAISQVLMGIGFLTLGCHPGFNITLVSFWFIGLGEALNLALNNVFCASLRSGTSALGLLHGSYGAGGTVGPFLATSMLVRNVKWSYFYWVNFSCTIFNGINSAALFRSRNMESQDPQRQPLLGEEQRSVADRDIVTINEQPPTNHSPSIFTTAMRSPTTILGAIFIFAYQGAEVSMSGWMVEFLISYRSGDPALVGYVTVGFWAGISIGRFFISPLAHNFGEKKSVSYFTAGCVGLQIVVWFLRSIIGNAIATGLIGLLLGPVYPCAVSVFGKTLPHELHLTSLSVISAMGSSGGAIMPFLVGLLAQRFGTVVVHPLCVLMYIIMIISWLALPEMNYEEEGSCHAE